MTKPFQAIIGVGLLLALSGAADARPAPPQTNVLFMSGVSAGGGHVSYSVVRKSHRRTHRTSRSHRMARSRNTGGAQPNGRPHSSMTPGTSNVTMGAAASTPVGAGGGTNSVGTHGSQRRRVPPPGPLTNNGQAAPQTGTP